MTGINFYSDGTSDILDYDGVIRGNTIGSTNNTSDDTSAGLSLTNTGTGDALALFTAGAVTYAMGVDNSNSDRFGVTVGSSLALTTGTAFIIDSSGRVGIGGIPNSNGSLTLNGTTQGFVLNRLSAAQLTTLSGASPTAGTLVYDTTLNKLRIFTGTIFEVVTSA